MRHEASPDRKMGGRALVLGDRGIGGLLDPVGDELVRARQALDQFSAECILKRRVDLGLRGLEHGRKRCDVSDRAEASQLLQRLLRFGRQAGEFSDHEVHDIVGVALGVNALKVPFPALRVGIEGEQALVGEGVEKLNREEWITAGPRINKLRQRRGQGRTGSQCSASAMSCLTCSSCSGASLISLTFAPELRIAASLRASGWVASTSLS